jgi:hypothetical protein
LEVFICFLCTYKWAFNYLYLFLLFVGDLSIIWLLLEQKEMKSITKLYVALGQPREGVAFYISVTVSNFAYFFLKTNIHFTNLDNKMLQLASMQLQHNENWLVYIDNLTFSRTSNETSLNQETREVFAFPQLHNLQEMSSSQNNHNDVVTQVYKQIFSRLITNLPFTQLEHERCKTQDETTLNKRSGDVSFSSQQFDTCLLITKVVTDEKKRNVNELVADLPLSQHECERCEIQEGHIGNEQNKDISHSQSNTSTGYQPPNLAIGTLHILK